MEFQKLSSLLEKFKILAISHETIKKEIIGIILKKTGILVRTEHITIKNNTLLIEENPAVRSVIFIHKQSILAALKEKLDKKAPTDIR